MATPKKPAVAGNLALYLVLLGTVVTGAGDDRVETPAGETVELSEKDAAPLLASETIKLAPGQPEAAAAPAPAAAPAQAPANTAGGGEGAGAAGAGAAGAGAAK